jgi:hypothetical protein
VTVWDWVAVALPWLAFLLLILWDKSLLIADLTIPREYCGAFSILRQEVDFTKLLLKLLDSLDAIRMSFSEMLGRHGRPAFIAGYNRNRD